MRHSIVKAYTLKEMIEMNVTITNQAMPLLAASVCNSEPTLKKGNPQEQQMFTLSTKKILNDTVDVSSEIGIKMDVAIQIDEDHNKEPTTNIYTDESPLKEI